MFGTPDEVASYLLADSIRLHWLEDGDHSFKPRNLSGRTETQNWQEAVTVLLSFIGDRTGSNFMDTPLDQR